MIMTTTLAGPLCACALATILSLASAAGSERLGGFPDMTSGLNSVPRIGRRSLSNPFGGSTDRFGSAGFRFVRDRRAWPLPGGGLSNFRFYGGPDAGETVHKRNEVKGGEGDITKRDPGPSPHPLPRPYATVKADQQAFWEDLVSEAARSSILQKLAQAAYDKAQATQTAATPGYGSSPLARFLSRYGGSPNRPPGIYNGEPN